MMQDEELAIGTVLDNRYRLEVKLGAGGMGVVYGGVHMGISRPIAIKVMRQRSHAGQSFAARFEREAYATARLDHPNCVGILDAGETEDGRPFLVMPRIFGSSLLDELVAVQRMEPARALRIMRHVLTALAHAHKADLIHRDVKPGNVMISAKDGDQDFAMLLDFGVVKLVGEAQREAEKEVLTQAGFAIGSPMYMSPEQVGGGKLDGRSDVYSAAVVLYEMVAGRPPFLADDQLECIRMHLQTPPPTFAELRVGTEFDPALESMIRHGLEKHLDKRIASAAEFIERIDAVLASMNATRLATLAEAAAGTAATAAFEAPATTAATAAFEPPVSAAPLTSRGLGHEASSAAVGFQGPPQATPPLLGTQDSVPLAAPHSPYSRHRSIVLVGGVAALAVLVAIVLAVRTGAPPDEPAVDRLESLEFASVEEPSDGVGELRRRAVERIPELESIHAAVQAGRRDAAIKSLHKLRSKYPQEAYLALLHGTLFLDRLWCRDGYQAYKVAFSLDPSLRANPVVMRSAVAAFRSTGSVNETTQFIVNELGAPAIPFLEAALSDSNKNYRERVGRALRRLRAD